MFTLRGTCVTLSVQYLTEECSETFFINLDAEYKLRWVAYHKKVILSLSIQNSDFKAVLETKL